MKPFKPKELVARVRARLRRNEDEPAEMLSIDDVDIDVPAHKVTRAGRADLADPIGVRPVGGVGAQTAAGVYS